MSEQNAALARLDCGEEGGSVKTIQEKLRKTTEREVEKEITIPEDESEIGKFWNRSEGKDQVQTESRLRNGNSLDNVGSRLRGGGNRDWTSPSNCLGPGERREVEGHREWKTGHRRANTNNTTAKQITCSQLKHTFSQTGLPPCSLCAWLAHVGNSTAGQEHTIVLFWT